MKLNLCFIFSAAVIGLLLNSMDMLRIRLLIAKYKIDSHIFKNRFRYLVHKSNRPHSLGVYRRNKPPWDVVRTLEKLVNHEPSGE